MSRGVVLLAYPRSLPSLAGVNFVHIWTATEVALQGRFAPAARLRGRGGNPGAAATSLTPDGPGRRLTSVCESAPRLLLLQGRIATARAVARPKAPGRPTFATEQNNRVKRNVVSRLVSLVSAKVGSPPVTRFICKVAVVGAMGD